MKDDASGKEMKNQRVTCALCSCIALSICSTHLSKSLHAAVKDGAADAPRGDPNPGLPAPGSHAGSASPLGVPEVSPFQSWHRGAVALPGLSGEAGETAHLKMWPALDFQVMGAGPT